MTTFRITNQTSGADLGAFEADDKAGALDAMAKDAGYASFAESCETTGEDGSDLVVHEVASDDDIAALRAESITASDDEQARLCLAALAGDDDARQKCKRAIRDAAAMVD